MAVICCRVEGDLSLKFGGHSEFSDMTPLQAVAPYRVVYGNLKVIIMESSTMVQ